VVEVVDAAWEHNHEGMARLLRSDTFGELPMAALSPMDPMDPMGEHTFPRAGGDRSAAVKAAEALHERTKVQQRRADQLMVETIRQVRALLP
jgi:hypothetical protein